MYGLGIRLLAGAVIVVSFLAFDAATGGSNGAGSFSGRQWTTFQSPSGGYHLDLPAPGIAKTDTENDPTLGKILVHSVRASGATFSAEAGHMDLPDGTGYDITQLLDITSKGIIANMGGVTLSNKAAPLGRNPGHEYLVESKEMGIFCRVRVAVVSRRVVFATGCAVDRNDEVVTRVTSSLALN